jgi:hypothetical protein
MPAKPPRFRVMGPNRFGRYVVVDTVDIKIEEFASRQAAERDCNACNNAGRQKTSEPAELQVLRAKLRREGLTADEFEALNRPRKRDLLPSRRPIDSSFIDQVRRVLPSLLRNWAGQLARNAGIDLQSRRIMETDEIIDAVARAAWAWDPSFNHRAIEILSEKMGEFTDWWRLNAEGVRGVLAVHYLSLQPTRLKAAYLKISERSYFRKLDDAHRSLANSLAEGLRFANEFDLGSVDYLERYITAPDTDHSNDDADLYIDPDDMANL